MHVEHLGKQQAVTAGYLIHSAGGPSVSHTVSTLCSLAAAAAASAPHCQGSGTLPPLLLLPVAAAASAGPANAFLT